MKQHAWHKKFYSIHKRVVLNKPLVSSKYILGELLNVSEEDSQYEEDEVSIMITRSKKKVSFKAQPSKTSSILAKAKAPVKKNKAP